MVYTVFLRESRLSGASCRLLGSNKTGKVASLNSFNFLLIISAMAKFLIWAWTAAIAWFVPFTKVEEAHNTQAAFDFLFTGNVSDFHHFAFPDVVPRTCIGAATAAAMASIPVSFFSLTGVSALLAVRFSVALLSAISLDAVRKALGITSRKASLLFLAFLLSSFHLPFYASRLLPNTFGLIFTNFALAAYLSGDLLSSLSLIAAGAALFRCDLLVIAAPLGLEAWYKRGFVRAVGAGIAGILVALVVTVPVDSIFWRKGLIWPEGVVLWFNTVLNKSHLWGTLPFSWYFQVALPKGLGLPVALTAFLPWSDYRARRIFLVWVFVPVFCLSFLPHKELRFIFPSVVAGIAVVASIGADLLKKFPGRTVRLVLIILVAGNFALSGARFVASYYNYPAAHALLEISNVSFSNEIVPGREGSAKVERPRYCKIHFGAFAAISGISRFLHPLNACTVDPSQGEVHWEDISMSLVEENKGCPAGFKLVARAPVFEKFLIERVYPFISVKLAQAIGVCRRN